MRGVMPTRSTGGAGVPMGPSPGLALCRVGVISDLGFRQEREIELEREILPQKTLRVLLDRELYFGSYM